MTTAYPLEWPQGWPRTAERDRKTPKFNTRQWSERGTYKVTKALTVAEARLRLSEELDLLGGKLPVLSTNIELRLDGQPRSGKPEPHDPGAAAYFQTGGKPRVLACDRWNTVAGNIAAIAAHISALRSIDRWGVGSMDRLFEGFMALPAPGSGPHWREVLVYLPDSKPTRADLEARRRDLAREAHPDRPGGSAEQMATINAAFDEAVRELRL